MKYHVLGPSDLPHMQSLLSLFGRAFDEPDTYDAARPGPEYLASLLGSPAFLAIAALHEERVVGGLTAYVLPKFEQARTEVYVYDLAVDEPFRRQGIATGLIQTLRALAFQRGAWVIFVQADAQDAPAVALYSKLGVGEQVIHFDISPQHPPAPRNFSRSDNRPR